MDPIPRLYFASQTGCGHCEEARPHVDHLRRDFALQLFVIELHLDRREWNILGWAPKATPGYALVVGDRIERKHEGILDYKNLIRFVNGEDFDGQRRRRKKQDAKQDVQEQEQEQEQDDQPEVEE